MSLEACLHILGFVVNKGFQVINSIHEKVNPRNGKDCLSTKNQHHKIFRYMGVVRTLHYPYYAYTHGQQWLHI